MNDAWDIYPRWCSKDSRYVLEELARIGYLHKVEIPTQTIGEIIMLELTVYQFPAETIRSMIKDFFPKWKKNIEAGKDVKDARHIAYYTDSMRPMGGEKKSIRESARVRKLRDEFNLNTFTDVYYTLVSEFAQADITSNELQLIVNNVTADAPGNGDSTLCATMRMAMGELAQQGKSSIAYLMTVLPSYKFKVEIEAKRAQYHDSKVLSLPTVAPMIDHVSSEQAGQEWEMAIAISEAKKQQEEY